MYHQGKTKGSSSMKVVSTYGMNRMSSEAALTACSEGVYRWKKASRSSNNATHHMEDIMVHSALIQRSGKVDSFGQPCMKTWKTSSGGVEHVKGMGISIQEMPCHSPTTFRLSSLMSRESITWDLFRSQRTVNTSWWKLTRSPSGLKPCHAKLLMQRTLRKCLKKQYFHDLEFREWWLAMEALTSLIRTFASTCQNMGSITISLLHTTLR